MSQPQTAQTLILTGMHRSGTSLMASLVQAMGIHVGDRLLAGDTFNAPGYFEDEDFLDFQRRVLSNSCDRTDEGWVDWGWTETESLDRTQFQREDYRQQAQALIASRQHLSSWGWKDPRTSLMLEFWAELLPEARFLLVYRLPWDVVDSIVRLRSGVFDGKPHMALKIWAYYNRHLLAFYQQHRDRCLLVNTQACLEYPEQFSRLVVERLGLDVPNRLDRDRVAQLYKPELFHSLSDSHPLIESIRHRTPQFVRWLAELEQAADLSSDRREQWQGWLTEMPTSSIDLVTASQFPTVSANFDVTSSQSFPTSPAINSPLNQLPVTNSPATHTSVAQPSIATDNTRASMGNNAPETASAAMNFDQVQSSITPIVSIVIPCYNQGEYILEAITSVQACPEPVYEIVIVNDVSNDPLTIKVLNYLRSKGFKIIDHAQNGGLSQARNTGIQQAQGRYILPLDADNKIKPNYITKAIQILDAHPEIGVVYGDVEYIGDKTGILHVPEFDINRLAVGNFIDACAVIRRSLWADCGGYDTKIPDRLGYEDWDLWLTAAAKGWKFYHEPEVLFEYRVRRDSMVSGCNQPENRRRLMHYFCAKHIEIYAANFADIFALKDAELLAERNHNALLEDEKAALHQTIQKQQAELISFQTELHQANLQIQTTQAKLLPLEAQVQAKQVEIAAKLSEIADLRQELTATHQQLYAVSLEREQLQQQLQGLEAEIAHLQQQLEATGWENAQIRQLAKDTIAAMQTSKFWQLRDLWLTIRNPLAQKLGRPAELDVVALNLVRLGANPAAPPPAPAVQTLDVYAQWRKRHDPKPADLQRMRSSLAQLSFQPTISLIVPVYNPSRQFLTAMIESVLSQVYPHWELCLADDASTEPHVREVITRYEALDDRIKVEFRSENGHISAASNSALSLATGEFIALLDHDDALAPQALYEMVAQLNQQPDLDMIYSDEDKIDTGDRRFDPFFKPDWCPDSFLSRMYTCHLGVYRRTLVDEIGGFRVGFEGAQDYDFVLRFTELTQRIAHLPKILYHWRSHPQSTAQTADSKDYAAAAAQRALSEAIVRRGEPGRVLPSGSGHWIIRYEIVKPGAVTIVIPTKDLASTLEMCLRSIFSKTTYPDYEVLVVDNGSVEAATRELFDRWSLKEADRFRVVPYPQPFNYSKLNNFAVEHTDSPYLLFLNNDTEVIDGDWLTAMVEQGQRSSIGAVGATLLYPDDTIQHAGVVLGIGGVAGHSHKTFPHGSGGYVAQLKTINNYSAVTAACLLCRREVFLAVGGFEERLQIAFNDVDFCLKLIEKGYRNVHLPHVVLYHYESKSRGFEDTPEKQLRFKQEIDYMRDRWGELLDADPCYSPHLTRATEDYAIQP